MTTTPKPLGVPSPCISVCRMNAQSGLCDGCFRSLNEIAVWGSLGEAEKRAVWKAIAQRKTSGTGT